jgi:hypothetical protein
MKQARSVWMGGVVGLGLVFLFSLTAAGQQGGTVAPRITQAINLEQLVTLRGNTHPLARPEFDQGAASAGQPMERILLVLQRSPQQESALENLLLEQQMKSSSNYHMWLTPEQFGEQFGPADSDLQKVTDWLTAAGFRVNRVAAGRTVIEFSGTAGAVRDAFHTEIHKYAVNGEEHWANSSDPQIPAALAPVVAGFASLNNFPKKTRVRRLNELARAKLASQLKPGFTYPYSTGYLLAVGPGDFATIYNVSPLYSASIDGTGEAIAVAEQSNINMQDVAAFRTMFNLPANAAQSNAVCSPGPQNGIPVNLCLNGPDPGVLSYTGDEGEAALDVQWAGAIAKGATVDMVVSESTEVTTGIDLSALYIVDNNLAPVMSVSYGLCEALNGAGENQFYNVVWEQGAAEGITIVIANGDSGSAGCDDPTSETAAQNGLAVSGNATTAFNVAVGGTDFNEGTTSTGWQQYWNYSTTAAVYPSAKSYIPETTWNDTCASTGSLTQCANGVSPDGSDLVAGSGGPSNCINPTTNQAGNLACVKTNGITGNPKPYWQTGTGVPSDGVRDTPDVSFFAGDGANGSFYIYCQMDANATVGGSATSCDLNSPYLDFIGAGGTSFAAPSFAGIMAMVNQKTTERQGNANFVLYPMAAASGASCGSNASMAATASSSSCIFYDIQSGNDSVACVSGSPNCSATLAQQYGILVNPNSTAQAAWTTSAGYDLASGLGSVNAANLVNKWSSYVGSFAPTTTSLTISPTTLTHGQQATVSVKVTSGTGTPAGDVSLLGGPTGAATGITYVTLSSGSASEPTLLLPGGTYNVTAHYNGDGVHGASDSSPVSVTVGAENSKTLVEVLGFNCSGPTGAITSAVYGSNISCTDSSTGATTIYSGYLLRVDVTNSSGNLCTNSNTGIPAYACPTGAVTVTNNGGPVVDVGAPSGYSGTYSLNSQGYAEDQYIQLPGGTDNLSVTYAPHPIAPNNSYNGSTGTASISISPAPTSTAVSSSQTTVTSGASVTLTATVNTTSLGVAPTGSVAFKNGSTLIGGTVTYTGASASATSYASLTASVTTSFTAAATITAVYTSADQNYSSSTTTSSLAISISSGTPDFSLSATPKSFTITSPGASGSTQISASAIGGFTGIINLSCSLSTAMSYSSCSLTPTSFSPGGVATLTVNTTAPSSALPHGTNPPRWFLPGAGLMLASTLLLLLSGKRRRAKLAFSLLVLAVLAAALGSCGGGSNNGNQSNPGTPTGTYTATVTATSGTLSHTLNIPVTVQ